jgi:hypothetical protein
VKATSGRDDHTNIRVDNGMPLKWSKESLSAPLRHLVWFTERVVKEKGRAEEIKQYKKLKIGQQRRMKEE